jgi:hypothetical protein
MAKSIEQQEARRERESMFRLLAGIPVTSKDPRKAQAVTNLKQISRGTKVTNVKYHGTGFYSGDCFKHIAGSNKYEPLGTFDTFVIKD